MLYLRSCTPLTTVVSCVLVSLLTSPRGVAGHGRLMDPPARTSMWRLQEFSDCPNGQIDDTNLNCGGNKGRCGPCGDPTWKSTPRKGEELGTLDCNRTTRSYTTGGFMDVKVKITQKHSGSFQFRLCARNATDRKRMSVSDDARRDCLARHLLADAGGQTSFGGINRKGDFRYQLKLPDGVQCDYCFLQWRYLAGNGQEYYGCSDIQIRPAISAPTTTTSTTTPTTTTRRTTPSTTTSTTTTPTTTKRTTPTTTTRRTTPTTTTRVTTPSTTERATTTTTRRPAEQTISTEQKSGIPLQGDNSLLKSDSTSLFTASQKTSTFISAVALAILTFIL